MIEPVLTVAEMRAAEHAAMDDGTSEWELMQRAGHGAAQWVARMAAGRAVTVLCGPGRAAELQRVLEALSPHPMPIDEIARASSLSAARCAAVLLELELSGEAQTLPGGLAAKAF